MSATTHTLNPDSRPALRETSSGMFPMRALAWFRIIGAGAVLGAGCAQRYQVTLGNGTTLATRSQPKLDHATGTGRFMDSRNKPVVLPMISIREMERL